VIIGVVKEARRGETRVAATPATVEQLRKLGYEVVAEILCTLPEPLWVWDPPVDFQEIHSTQLNKPGQPRAQMGLQASERVV
jgi:hypothetical protein